MENVRSLIIQAVENTYENIVKNDEEYKKLEAEKSEIINELKMTLKDEDFQKVETLIDCFDGQNFITAMGFCFVRVLDLDKLLEN